MLTTTAGVTEAATVEAGRRVAGEAAGLRVAADAGATRSGADETGLRTAPAGREEGGAAAVAEDVAVVGFAEGPGLPPPRFGSCAGRNGDLRPLREIWGRRGAWGRVNPPGSLKPPGGLSCRSVDCLLRLFW